MNAMKCVPIPVDRPDLVGLKILCLSDTHDFQSFMPNDGCNTLPNADILVHAGDFTVRGTAEEIGNFQLWMEQLLAKGTVKHVVCCAGNHELNFQPECSKHAVVRARQEAVKASFAAVPNLHYLEDTGVLLCGVYFHGSPWTTPVAGKMDWAFQARDPDLTEKWKLIPQHQQGGKNGNDAPPLFLVTHSPPYGVRDELSFADKVPGPHSTDALRRNGKVLGHLGSRTLLEQILDLNPLVHVFGHFHEGYGVSTSDCKLHCKGDGNATSSRLRTTFVNAAICDADYQPVNPPILLELCRID